MMQKTAGITKIGLLIGAAISAVGLLTSSGAIAAARAFQMSAEFGGPPGLTEMNFGADNQSLLQQQQSNNISVINFPPGTVLSDCGGTISLKTPGELLIMLSIDGTTVRSMEFITNGLNSWVFDFAIPTSWTPQQALLNFAYINNSDASNFGNGVEYQISCSAQ
jgi:hypothetical protein